MLQNLGIRWTTKRRNFQNVASMRRMLPQKRLAAPIVRFNRLRVNAAEQGIMRAVQRGDLAGGARQQLLKAPRAHAEQRLMREPQF